jgi:threonylcarbamoyladenosine tRNA methylthiotransferase MtaB
VDKVVREVQRREAEGVLEVVLTGTQLGNYGRDLGWKEIGPRRLLEELLTHTHIPRIRMSSVQAQDISDALLRLWGNPRLCAHFHLPLQSGSDTVLGPMRRRYTAEQFRRAVAAIREHVPHVAITTDVIAGFPRETEDDFEATLRLCEEMQFADMHCFPYSKRPQTGAAVMDGHLPSQVRRGRLERLLELTDKLSTNFRRGYLGRAVDVLWEERKEELWEGLTGNYMRIYADADDDLQNRILPVRLESLHAGGVRGALISRAAA